MARLDALEKNDFAPIRSLLTANYGDAWSKAAISSVSSGNQSFTYKIELDDKKFFFKIAEPRAGIRTGMPEQFSQYLGAEGLPTPNYEKMKDGRIAKALPTEVGALKQIIPSLDDNAEITKRLSGATLSLSYALNGAPIPQRSTEPDAHAEIMPQIANDVGVITGKIASKTQDFLAKHHLTASDMPPSGYNDFEKAGDRLLKALHLDAFGSFDEVYHQLHDKNSPASQHLHLHANILRSNAALMEKAASSHPQGELLKQNATTLKLFADRYESGLALELMHYTAQMIKIKPRLLARENTLCHGDMFNQNILTQDGNITGILDFGSMQRGDKLNDVIHYFGQMEFNPFLIQQALKGYEQGSGTKLSQEDLALLPYLKLQHEMTGVPLDLKFAFEKGFPKDVMNRKLTEADIMGSTIEAAVPARAMHGRFDDLKPYIHADYSAIINQPQFDTSLFRSSGRIHAEGGAALFDYIGAVFSPYDFNPENASRLTEKLDTVIDNEVRLRLFTANNPDRREYTIDEVVQMYPSVNIPDSRRETRRNELIQEVRAKLEKLPNTMHPYEEMMEKQLAELPPLLQEWLYLKGTEFTFTAGTTTNADGKLVYKGNEDMFPNHPAVAHMRRGGGNFLTYNPTDKNGITYAYTSMQRDPRVLLAHEAIGHALFNEARQRSPEDARQVNAAATNAAMADLGDINKTKDANPNPDNGRLGALKQAVDSSPDDETLWKNLQKIDGTALPNLSGEDRSRWLKNVRTLTKDTFEKLGPNGWMHNVKMYADRNLFMDEIIAATAEQMFVSGKGKESAMSFVLPALTGFFGTTLMGEMKRFVEEKRSKDPAQEKTETLAAVSEEKLREETKRRELIEESNRLDNFSSASMGVAVLAVTGAAVAALSGAWIIAAGCALVSGAGFFGSTQWGKEARAKFFHMPERKTFEVAHANVVVEPILAKGSSLANNQGSWQQKVGSAQIMDRAI